MASDPDLPAEALALLDAAACGLLKTSAKGTIVRVNRTFCGWLGRSAEELVGRTRFQDLLTMGGRIFHQTHWAPLLQMQGSISEVKLELLHRDGTAIPMVLNARRHDERGTVAHEIAAFVAWDRDKYERELLASRKRLEELVAEATLLQAAAKDRALFAEQMIGIVSHDLRNPLSSITMAVALLERGGLTPSQQRNVARIARSAEKARWLTADLLDFTAARLGRGLSLSVDTIELHEVVSNCVDELVLVYPGRLLEHHRSGEGACRGDRHRLDQLVGNLVSNAMTYGSHDAPVKVTSAVGETTFSIEVHNRGPTIPREIQSTLFQPMTRGTGVSNAGRSVGLGLFIVREIAKAHGGSVAVSSSEEEGTVFRAVFPRSTP